MSRNKFILAIIIGVIIFLLIPGTAQGLYVKEMMVRLTTYLLILFVIYLVITINLLKRSFKRLFAEANDENTFRTAKLLRFTFEVKRAFGVGTLKALFNHVNLSKNVSMEAKEELYEAIKRKKVETPPPAGGKKK